MEKNKALRWVGNFLLGKKKKSDLTNSKVASHSLKSYKSNPYHPPKKENIHKTGWPFSKAWNHTWLWWDPHGSWYIPIMISMIHNHHNSNHDHVGFHAWFHDFIFIPYFSGHFCESTGVDEAPTKIEDSSPVMPEATPDRRWWHVNGMVPCWNPQLFSKVKIMKPSTLVGGWTNPSEKYARQIGNLPLIGVKIKNLWNHHLGTPWQFCDCWPFFGGDAEKCWNDVTWRDPKVKDHPPTFGGVGAGFTPPGSSSSPRFRDHADASLP